jgi:hypothetical protein
MLASCCKSHMRGKKTRSRLEPARQGSVDRLVVLFLLRNHCVERENNSTRAMTPPEQLTLSFGFFLSLGEENLSAQESP